MTNPSIAGLLLPLTETGLLAQSLVSGLVWPVAGWLVLGLVAWVGFRAMLSRLRTGFWRLLRFFGYRKLGALLLAPVVALAVKAGLSILLPRNLTGMDPLAAGFWWLAWGWWWKQIALPIRGLGQYGREVCQFLTYYGWGILGASALLWYLTPGSGGEETSVGGGNPTLAGLWWRSGLPLFLGAVVAFLPDCWEWLVSRPAVRRHLISEGDRAFWLGPWGIRRFVRRWPRRVPDQTGYLSSAIFVGSTTFESNYRPRDEVELDENAHLATVAMTGGGKKLAMAAAACTYWGSCIFLSPKPELADEFCGRRIDQTLFEKSATHSHAHLGVDPRGISQVEYQIPGGRGFVLDPANQSVYDSSFHTIVSEFDLKDPFVTELITAVARGSFPDQPQQRDKFWTLGPRGYFASSIAHILSTDPDPAHWNLPFIADFCMGIDPIHQRADRDVFQANLLAMLKNPALGGFVQRGAANIFEQMGTNAYGGLRSEFENNTRWITTPWMRQHLSQPSQFSYREVGVDNAPVSIFLVPPRGDAAFQATLPWTRTHTELSLQILQTKTNRPSIPTLVVCDEFRQYGGSGSGGGIEALRNGLTILRDAKVKLWIFAQSWPSLVDILGEEGAAELESCATMQYFACNDQATAEKISRTLGRSPIRQPSGKNHGSPEAPLVDLVTPAEVLQELRQSSNLQYVFPTSSAPMRLERVAHKPIRTREGGRFAGLPLQGHFDDSLSRYTYGVDGTSNPHVSS